MVGNRNRVALEYGPIVYCAEEADNKNTFNNIQVSDSAQFDVEYKPSMLNGINVIKTTGENSFLLIPYYAWSNRGVGKMDVWIPR